MSWNIRLEKLNECINSTMENMISIWSEMGICSERCEERQGVFFDHLEELVDEMQSEEQGRKEYILNNIEKDTTEVQILCEQLRLSKYEPAEGLSLLQLEKDLRVKLQSLTEEKNKRESQLKKLKEQMNSLSLLLASEPIYISLGPNDVPTADQLKDLKEHVDILRSEKERRTVTVGELRSKIGSLFLELEMVPATQFEKQAVASSESLLTRDNISDLEKLHSKLSQKQRENEKKSLELREKLHLLWARLRIEKDERDAFLEQNHGHHPRVIRNIEQEIKRCEILKLENIKVFVEELREELRKWWESCLVGKDEQDVFRAYFDESYSEDLLELHDLEVKRWREYFEENKTIFAKINKRHQMWQKLMEFEQKAHNPDRFVNRGGCLLQEEKERKRLTKELPKLEQELQTIIEEWEETHEKPFRVNGERYLDVIATQWEAFSQEKENAKLERQKAKAKQLEEAACGTPGKRKGLGTPLKTPISAKRVRPTGSSTRKVTPKVRITSRNYGHRLSGSRTVPSKFGRSRNVPRGTPGTTSRVLQQLNSNETFINQSAVSGSLPPVKSTSIVDSGMGTYHDFAKPLINSDGIFNSTEFSCNGND